MSDPVTQSQFYAEMQKLSESMQEYHRRGRDHADFIAERLLADFNQRLNRTDNTFRNHELADIDVEHRVTVIEAEREVEQRLASKHGAIAGTITSGLVVGLIEAVRRIFSHP